MWLAYRFARGVRRATVADSDALAGAAACEGRGDGPRLTKALPPGHAFVCMDTRDIPKIMQRIFTSTMMKGM